MMKGVSHVTIQVLLLAYIVHCHNTSRKEAELMLWFWDNRFVISHTLFAFPCIWSYLWLSFLSLLLLYLNCSIISLPSLKVLNIFSLPNTSSILGKIRSKKTDTLASFSSFWKMKLSGRDHKSVEPPTSSWNIFQEMLSSLKSLIITVACLVEYFINWFRGIVHIFCLNRWLVINSHTDVAFHIPFAFIHILSMGLPYSEIE